MGFLRDHLEAVVLASLTIENLWALIDEAIACDAPDLLGQCHALIRARPSQPLTGVVATYRGF
jgi:hypothetical protein